MDQTDDALLATAIAGDREALATLLERHGPEVRQRLAGGIPRRWRSVISEDDVMQQTYADAALGIARFRDRGGGGGGSLAAWLHTLARHNLLDAIRMLEAEKRGGTRRRVEAPLDGESHLALYEYLGATSSTPSRHAARKEAVTALDEALRQLPPAYRQVVQMYELEGRPVEEVAAELKRSKGAIYMLRSRALEGLAGLMGTASRYLSSAP